MCKIFIAPEGWNPTKSNPFTANGEYGEQWSAFIYDEKIGYYSNIYEDTFVYVFRVNPEIDCSRERLLDYLNYETVYGRKVILSLPDYIDFNEILEKYKEHEVNKEFRDCDEKYLVHSTTKEAFESIKETGAILSPNELKRQGIQVLEIGLKPMLEPKDYSDYVMLDVLNGCGELVVNSRQLGYVCTNPDIEYAPGVRLYFEAEAIIKDGLGTRDGLHILKIKDKLPLDKYLIASVTPKLFKEEVWTPTTFTNAANEHFLKSVKE